MDIVIRDTIAGCPYDYEPMFNRQWNGTKEVCLEDPDLAKYFKKQ